MPPLLTPPPIENWPGIIGVGIIMGGGETMPGTGCGLITPGIGWKPIAELLSGTKSDCFLGLAWDPSPAPGLPPPLSRAIKLSTVSSSGSESEP